jgi:phosphatidyl-myo-inositol dimannoside synthase
VIQLHLWAPAFKGSDGISQFSHQLQAALERMNLVHRSLARPRVAFRKLKAAEKIVTQLAPAIFLLKVGIAALFSRPNLIISTHLNFGPAALLLNRLFGMPYVLIAHGIDVNDNLSPLRRQAIRSATAIWAVSHWTAQRLQNQQLVAQNIQVLPNTVSPNTFFPTQQHPMFLCDRYGINPSTPVILTVARLEAHEGYKGYDTVIRAIPALLSDYPDLRYLIAGQGSDYDRLQRLICDLDLLDHVSLIGFVPDVELADHYRLADVFAMPSTGEGFGIVFLEALACGCPVLAGNQDGSVDALVDGKLGLLVNPTDVQAVADGLGKLLARQGPALWFDPVQLHQAVIDRFGPEAFQQRLKTLLFLLLSISSQGAEP